ncbi:hypothetical protein EVG20_g6256 [Dentipellis fragilis]|uniref:O-methyltransferase C-terminal domain-containing protein n=1 Tax=Dentipellis fragilis TaxID=205917 RepID=A0A4Y9YRB2_9AGAM|nr:hypothetical protein EVG20_g6256 [Dentipellis fragilis]
MSTTTFQLLNLIQMSLATLKKSCAATGHQIPELHESFTPSSEAFRADPAAALAADTAAAAALHLAAILLPPYVALHHVTGGHYRSTAARVCLELHVTEILREAGPQASIHGLHVNGIAAKNGQDPKKLARFLRYLAINHVYHEVSPDVFANTCISSMLDMHKSSAEIIADLDDTFKASAYTWETLSDPRTSHSGEATATPFCRALGINETVWEFYSHPDQKYRQRRFDAAMQGGQALQPVDAIFDAYDWEGLAPGSVVVDVGGGVGTSAFPLARDFPALKLVVQDLSNVIEDLWSTTMLEAVESGRMQLEAHDFFKAQPKHDVPISVFLLKQIIHDWSDQYALKILKRLRDAAAPDTKLVLVDTLIGYACRQPSDNEGKQENGQGIPGAMPVEAPEPLLVNFGAVREMASQIDIAMFILYNGQERTFHHLQRLLREAGWALRAVRQNEKDSAYLQGIEAVPILPEGGRDATNGYGNHDMVVDFA